MRLRYLAPLIISLFFCGISSAAVEGPNVADLVSSVDRGITNVTWANTSNISVSDNVYTTGVYDPLGFESSPSDYLQITDFDFSIPFGATINGVVVTVDRKSDIDTAFDNIRDETVQLIVNGSLVGDNKADTGTNWGTTESTATYGSSSDVWNAGLDSNKINATNFGVAIATTYTCAVCFSETASIDYVTITVYYTDANPNGAVSFDGTDDQVIVPDNPSLDFTGPMTISLWVYPTDINNTRVFLDQRDSGGSNGYYFYQNSGTVNGRISFAIQPGSGGAGQVHSTFAMSNNKWYHLVGRYDGSTMKLFINGTEESSISWTTNPTASAHVLNIGSTYHPTAYWKGYIEEIAFFNKSLSTSEISQLYGNGSPKKYLPNSIDRSSLVAYWPLDDFTLGVTASGVKTIRDYSENGNHGTPANSPVGATGNLKNATQRF